MRHITAETSPREKVPKVNVPKGNLEAPKIYPERANKAELPNRNDKEPKCKNMKEKVEAPCVKRRARQAKTEKSRFEFIGSGKNCIIHRLFPCLKCVPWFIEHRQWPTLDDRSTINKQWKKRKVKNVVCLEHKTMFCRRCYSFEELFEMFGEKGMQDRFLCLVKEVRYIKFSFTISVV